MEEQQHRNALPQGFKLFEYEIQSVLGKPGGFGITYLATDTHLRQSVAIKEYLPSDFAIREGRSTVYVKSSSYDESFQWGLKCFIEEAQVLAKFNHHNIVRVSRFFELNGTAYMVMEYQKGQSLTEFLKQQRVLTEEELKTIVVPLLEGLEEIHQAGVLHRDIKPNNIYLRDDNTPVLLDFGSARFAIGQKTRSVTSIVTPGYAPLEQYDNEVKDQGPWTDIYALGAVMYNAITGESPPAATRRVMKDPMIPAVKVGAGRYSRSLLLAIDWALQLSEEDRPQTVEQWRDKMLATSDDVPEKKQVAKQYWTSINIAGIGIIILLCAISSYFGYENYIYNSKLQSLQHALNQAELKILQEQNSCKADRKYRKIHQNYRKECEAKYDEASGLLKEVQRFKIGTESLQADIAATKPTGFETKQYYKVTNVTPTDILNVREFAGTMNDIVGEIPPFGLCIEYLGNFRFRKGGLWVKIRYDNIEGWVHSHYLHANEQNCEGKSE
ncbi:serine/threonine protein kinase [Candidatus Halobeggiatoa sp. HSG11]|nr:serine/threonine protein kinase [Candidatus Halobeggiatoa sp. HSG11]